MLSIATLLQAAEFLERRDREAEHGYATPAPSSAPLLMMEGNQVFLEQSEPVVATSRPAGAASSRSQHKHSKKSSLHLGSRSSHNELEKNRRAHLRSCLENLKDLVPLGSDSSRHTTLGLLNKAKHYIRTLEDKDQKSLSSIENLFREQRYLRRRLELLSSQVDAIHKRRSISESSSSTTSSIQSSESDEHEVDVIGWGGVSDDDGLSVRSSGSEASARTGAGSDAGVNTWNQLAI